jgi:hypothetical protein
VKVVDSSTELKLKEVEEELEGAKVIIIRWNVYFYFVSYGAKRKKHNSFNYEEKIVDDPNKPYYMYTEYFK